MTPGRAAFARYLGLLLVGAVLFIPAIENAHDLAVLR